ncbi:hypothetical protein TIFTF001_021623 [Ficus carica]|uniref:Uncharacterized protein n=1 Tax=Ficus carica TaxID=3494 RepID=A0AA88AGA0_FICCA|nr:hypothetical protein TIFTF001_021623 [Ficus carica]
MVVINTGSSKSSFSSLVAAESTESEIVNRVVSRQGLHGIRLSMANQSRLRLSHPRLLSHPALLKSHRRVL